MGNCIRTGAVHDDVQVDSLQGVVDRAEDVLTPEALAFVAELHHNFEGERRRLLKLRTERQTHLDTGNSLQFIEETSDIRKGDWSIAGCPSELSKRWVEITGPPDRRMMINALGSGANVYMADLEDSLAPTWANVVTAQINLYDAVRGVLSAEINGETKRQPRHGAVLMMRPRGLHMEESHYRISGQAISASLFDFGIFFYLNSQELLDNETGPYFYLPKLESHQEARFWNNVFIFSQERMGLQHGTIRASVLIETLPAAFEMEEILYELKEHVTALNAGRWDYIFSSIKRNQKHKEWLLPDRHQITMEAPFLRAFARLLVKTCHKRGAHAIGGMSAYIPNRRDVHKNEIAIRMVVEDKGREGNDGFDGTWVAHPALVALVMDIFSKAMDGKDHQKDKAISVDIKESDLLNVSISGGKITEAGLRGNISVLLQYLENWIYGRGCVAINGMMEETATAEIARAQLWYWMAHSCKLDSGADIDRQLLDDMIVDEVAQLGGPGEGRLGEATTILKRLIFENEFHEFLTTIAEKYL